MLKCENRPIDVHPKATIYHVQCHVQNWKRALAACRKKTRMLASIVPRSHVTGYQNPANFFGCEHNQSQWKSR